jgi:possible abortive infection phage resistance protein
MKNIEYQSFKDEWLKDIKNAVTTVEKGRTFAIKLVTQWLDNSDLSDNLIYCDGSRDGGIDIAFLDDAADDIDAENGHTWYLVQSKYGAAFTGANTLLGEGIKVIDTLEGKRDKLNSLAEGLLERLNNFRNSSSELDKIILLFATEDYLSEDTKSTIDALRELGRKKLGQLFDIESISIQTIYDRLQSNILKDKQLQLKGNFSPSGEDLLVGAIPLLDLYNFLSDYRNKTGDLDQIYEKNVRRFLGSRGKVNKGMKKTLLETPEKFGLYNNGITIVVSNFENNKNYISVTNPFIVNGCQTTRTIWEVFHAKLGSGGTGKSEQLDSWKNRVATGSVVVKIAKIGEQGKDLLQDITRFTNSQNAIKEKDFIALTDDFKTWKDCMSEKYGIYLEIQRGGWESQKVFQKLSTKTKQFQKHTNAADLIKVYGAGWLKEAGVAFARNQPFLPDGSIFKKILAEGEEQGGAFGVEDLYAAYLLYESVSEYNFGRNAKQNSRKQSRYLFFMVVLDLLRYTLNREEMESNNRALSNALIKVLSNEEARKELLTSAIEVIDTYLTQSDDSSGMTAFEEDVYRNTYNSDLNSFLKSEKIGKSEEFTPRLVANMNSIKHSMGRSIRESPSSRQVIISAIRSK